MGEPTGRTAWVRRSLERRSLLLALALAVGASAGIIAGILGIGETALAAGATDDDGGVPLAPLVWTVAGVPIATLALLGAAAARELSRLLALVRAGETAVLRSRGATRGRLVAASTVEALAVTLPASAVGVALAALLGLLLDGWMLPALAWVVVPAAVVAAAAIAAAGTRSAIAGAVLADRGTSAGRVRRTVGVGGIVLLIAASAVAVWQSAISRPAAGTAPSPVTQVLVGAAPALSLLTGALLVLAAVTALTRVLERGARTRRRLGGALLARQLARGMGLVAPAVVVIAFVAGMLVVAGAYGATWDRASTASRELANGSAVRVAGWDDAAPEGATRVLTAGVLSGDDPVALVAIPAAEIDTVVLDAAGVIERDALAETVAPELAGIAIPGGTTALDVAGNAPAGVAITVWVADRSGPVFPLRVEEGGELPAPTDGAVVVAVELDIAAAVDREVSVRLTGLVAVAPSGETELPFETPWEAQHDAVAELPGAVYAEEGIGVDVERRLRDRTSIRFMPGGDPAPMPMAVSEGLADRNALSPGDPLELRYEGAGRIVRGVVATIVPAIPGTGTSDGVLVDLAAFGVQQLGDAAQVPAPAELWSTESVDADDATTTAPTPRDAALGATDDAVRVGAIGGIALAAGAVLAIALALERARRREVALLQALGAAPAQQVAARAGELAFAFGTAAIGGGLVGIPVALLTVPGLVRIAAPELPATVPVGLLVDPLVLGIGAGILLAALAGIVLAVSWMVRRRAASGTEAA